MTDCNTILLSLDASCVKELNHKLRILLALDSILCLYIVALVGITIYKHKTRSFTFKLLLLLTLGVVCSVAEMTLLMIFLNHFKEVNKKLIAVLLGLLTYFVNVCGGLVYWVFSVKFWSIAFKIELAIQEKDTQQYNKPISALFFGGIAVIIVSGGITADWQAEVLLGKDSSLLFGFSIIFYLIMIVSCAVIFDALCRLARTKVQNKTISTQAVVFFSLCYAIELVGVIMQISSLSLVGLKIITFGYWVGVFLLATILYLIGIASIAAEDDSDAQLALQDSSDLLSEDQPEADSQFGPGNKEDEDVTVKVESRNSQNRGTLKLPRTEMQMVGVIMRNDS